MKALFLRWAHDRRGEYQDEGMLVLMLTVTLLLALIQLLLNSGVLSRLQDMMSGILR